MRGYCLQENCRVHKFVAFTRIVAFTNCHAHRDDLGKKNPEHSQGQEAILRVISRMVVTRCALKNCTPTEKIPAKNKIPSIDRVKKPY